MLSALKKQKVLFIILIAALVLALLTELLVFMSKTETTYEKETVSILTEGDAPLAFGYTVSGDRYTPSNADPQFVIQNVNRTVKTLVLVFSEPTEKRAALEIFYAEESGVFSQGKAVSGLTVPRGATEVPISLPEGTYCDLRIDLDGTFSLADVRISEGDFTQKTAPFALPFSFARVLILFVFLALAGLFFPYVLFKDRGPLGLKKHELLFLALLFGFYTLWAFEQPLNYAPDELMRYDVTKFLFEHGRLPVGSELLSDWGFSYAHLPAVLCNELGAVLMWLVEPFTQSAHTLLLAARMVSVICATLAIYFILKSCKLLFRPEVGWIVVFFVAFMPQYAFLSSYVNNDIVAFLGITMILYAWLLGMTRGWRISYAVLVALGISVCALSYYYSYAWILFSIFFCIFSFLAARPKDVKGLSKLVGVVSAVVLLLIGYSFIRHLVLYGDLLGMQTVQEYGELYAIESLKPSVRQSLAEQGISIGEMLFGNYKWVAITVKSFIACFGYMQYQTSDGVYKLILLLIGIGLCGALFKLISTLVKKRKPRPTAWAFYLSLLACAVITVFLCIRNSYVSDFQPQGRYCYPAFPTLVIFIGHGYDVIMRRLKKEHRYAITAVICTLLVSVCLYTLGTIYLPT